VDRSLTPAQEALRDRARRFVVDVLQPIEVEFERAGGRLPPERGRELRTAAIEAGPAGGELWVRVGAATP
jgi:alkylation response protein AidB-like acyl-CoA dehydrogenase